MNIYNNLNKEEKYLILVRKLKEAFYSFTDDLLEVFPKNNNIFIQRIIVHQLPDTSLYKLLKKNININLIEEKDILYLKYDLYFLKDYEQYLNENISSNYFSFKELINLNDSNSTLEENIEMIWDWINILIVIIKNIDKLLE
jgi:hypothetical protein